MIRSIVRLGSLRPGKFFTLAKSSVIMPDELSHLQTDGSFRYNDRISRTAALLLHEGERYTSVKTYFKHVNSHESEWSSILDGILMAKTNEAGAIKLENDNLSVINSLIYKRTPTQEYAKHYYFSVLQEAKNMEWLDIRWIPRKLNKSDGLFRIR
jgi:ribonuclease HI